MERERRSKQNQDDKTKPLHSPLISRRSLLKGAGLTVAAWGLGSRVIEQWSDASSAVLAAPARRKYALLIGIDQYNNDAHCSSLRGCVNDLEIQKNLLIHRFGFAPDDILTLKNKQANRSGVYTAMVEHLLDQVTAEDLVFIHFSGYGSQIQTEENGETQRTLVLHDSCNSGNRTSIKDLPESTLLLLLRALPTERIVSVLDAGYRIPEDSPISEGVNLRTRPSPEPAPLDAENFNFQTRLQAHVDARGILPSSSKSPGIILQTTDWVDSALEFEGQAGFVGLMTYALSQQLWQSDPETTWRGVMAEASGRLANELDSLQNIRLLEGTISGRTIAKSGLAPQGEAKTSGVVLATHNNNDIDLWLGGLSSKGLSYCSQGSVFTALVAESTEDTAAVEGITVALSPHYLQIYQRNGLRADARRTGIDNTMPSLPSGTLVREQIRVVPQQVELAIAIDQRLDRIERVDATSALTSIPNLSIVALHNQPADYIFGRVQAKTPTLVASLPNPEGLSPGADGEDPESGSVSDIPANPEAPGNQYGLLTLGREILPATVGASAEAIKTAVQRLQPHLETLRAAKNIEILDNGATTQLDVQARWEVLPNNSTSGNSPSIISSAQPSPLLKLMAGDRLRSSVKHESEYPIYVFILSFDPRGNWRPIGTANLTTPLNASISYQNEFNLGQWVGLNEIYTLCSISPFTETYQLLSRGNQRSPSTVAEQPVENPYQLSQTVLQDLSQASQSLLPPSFGFPGDIYPLNLSAWAGFRQAYSVQSA